MLLFDCVCVYSMKIKWNTPVAVLVYIVLDSVLQEGSCPVFRVCNIGVQVVVRYYI